MAIVTLCNFPSPGMLHLPSMINEMDVTSLEIMTVSLGWNGYCGGSDADMLPRLRRSGLLLLITLLRKGEGLLELELRLLHLWYRVGLLLRLLLLLMLLPRLLLLFTTPNARGVRLLCIGLGLLRRSTEITRGGLWRGIGMMYMDRKNHGTYLGGPAPLIRTVLAWGIPPSRSSGALVLKVN